MKCFGCGVEKQMGVFTMLIGIPGSGKSTWLQSDYGRRAKVLPEIVYRMYGEFLYTKQVLKDEGWSEITSYIDGGLNEWKQTSKIL